MAEMRRSAAVVLALGVLAITGGVAEAVTHTYRIDQKWDFHTSALTSNSRLVGTIRFDPAVSTFYPSAWDFTLVHDDPLFAAHYPISITGTYPDVSNYQNAGWVLYPSAPGLNTGPVLTNLTLGVVAPGDPGIIAKIANGTVQSWNYQAYEYVYRFPNASQRIIYNGVAAVPEPGAVGVLALAGVALARRRR